MKGLNVWLSHFHDSTHKKIDRSDSIHNYKYPNPEGKKNSLLRYWLAMVSSHSGSLLVEEGEKTVKHLKKKENY